MNNSESKLKHLRNKYFMRATRVFKTLYQRFGDLLFFKQ